MRRNPTGAREEYQTWRIRTRRARRIPIQVRAIQIWWPVIIVSGNNFPTRVMTRSMLTQESQKSDAENESPTPENSSGIDKDSSKSTSPFSGVTPLSTEKQKQLSVSSDHMSYNLPSPTAIDSVEKLINEKDRGDTGAISDVINKMYATMIVNHNAWIAYRTHSELKFAELDERMDKIDEKIVESEQKHSNHMKALSEMEANKASKNDVKLLSEEIKQLKEFMIKSNEKVADRMSAFDCALNAQNQDSNESRLEIKRLYKEHSITNEKINVWDIRNNRLTFTIDGLIEADENTSTIQAVMNKFNLDTKANLSEQDFISAHRIGKLAVPSEGQRVYPRPIRIKLKNDTAREKLLSNRGKLKPNGDKSIVWVNDDHPDEYRRRKLMLRELVKYISKNTKHKASIEAGGLNLDGQIIMPSQFDDLPADCHPERVQILSTKENGLAFAGQWAYLSNMYSCSFRYEGVNFSSSEQCFQYCKALHHEDLMKAKDIILTNDPFKCKKKGDAIECNEEWKCLREKTLLSIIRCKFEQNNDLRNKLIGTGDRKLFEATTSQYWGTGSGLRSKATREQSSRGENRFGVLLTDLRSILRSQNSSQAPPQ